MIRETPRMLAALQGALIAVEGRHDGLDVECEAVLLTRDIVAYTALRRSICDALGVDPVEDVLDNGLATRIAANPDHAERAPCITIHYLHPEE